MGQIDEARSTAPSNTGPAWVWRKDFPDGRETGAVASSAAIEGSPWREPRPCADLLALLAALGLGAGLADRRARRIVERQTHVISGPVLECKSDINLGESCFRTTVLSELAKLAFYSQHYANRSIAAPGRKM